MNDSLAERLLAKVMNWTAEEVSRERPLLKDMGNYRYDDYEQFSAGMRFVESLAVWLAQFESQDERDTAYQFVKTKLIYVSSTEMHHLIATSFGTIVKPILLHKVAVDNDLREWRVKRIVSRPKFMILLRQSVFLGLSDGAHTEIFRRTNPLISHEQVRNYEVTPSRADDMISELRKDLRNLLKSEPSNDEVRFRNAFLLDDFSGSGLSYLRKEGESGTYKGKIANFYKAICPPTGEMHSMFDMNDLSVHIVLYVATQHACDYLREQTARLFGNIPCTVDAVHLLRDSARLEQSEEAEFIRLLPKYYDKNIESPDYLKGKHDYPYLGFDECALPLVLNHNTPNNSIPLLWFEEGFRFRGLFPRVSRFKGLA